MKLTIHKSDATDDWCLIERAEHDGRTWDAKIDGGTAFCSSARICGAAYGDTPTGHSADVEDPAGEMLAIASAIERRGLIRFKRCGVDARREPVRIMSPCNGSGVDAEVTLAEADELAAAIRALLRGGAE